MYRIGICNRRKEECTIIENAIISFSKRMKIDLETEVWYSQDDICSYLSKKNDIDLLYLDAELFELVSTEVVQYLRGLDGKYTTQIIYLSKKHVCSLELAKTQPIDFIIKPILRERVEESLRLALKISLETTNKFQYKYGKNYYYIKYDEIIYFVSEGRKIKIVSLDKEQYFYGRLKEIYDTLPSDFIAIHQSYVVNKNYITQYACDHLVVLDKVILPISRAHRKNIREIMIE